MQSTYNNFYSTRPTLFTATREVFAVALSRLIDQSNFASLVRNKKFYRQPIGPALLVKVLP